MKEGKLENIKSLKSEIKEFQPLLHNLFMRLPMVTHVERTHGVNELGADFVVTKYDETLCDVIKVGVIVKLGRLGQDLKGIERQIDECDLDRITDGGKQKISIGEIWLIVSGDITHNAKLKIYSKYRNRNLKVIDVQKLVILIDKYYPEYWSELVDTSEFKEQLIRYLKGERSDEEDEGDDVTKIGIGMAEEYLTTMINNFNSGNVGDKKFQRKVSYRDVPFDIERRFKEYSHERGLELLVELNRWLATELSESGFKIEKEKNYKKVGLGIYYFSEE